MEKPRGFTVVEVLISIAIIAVIGALGISAFYGARPAKHLEVITDGLESTLTKAKADAMAGKYGSNFGVLFASTSYSYFVGSSYDASTSTNRITDLPEGWQIGTTTGNGSSYVVFTRLSGAAQTTATVTITYLPDPALTRQITIGPSGNISVIK